jgi:hypothetical protein
MRRLLPLLLLTACINEDGTIGLPKPWPDAGGGDDDTAAPGDDPSDPGAGPTGFVGSPCATDADCDYDGGLCLTETGDGFPAGTCSLECERLCPDADDAPVTFCATVGDLPTDAWDAIDVGACLSRCDFSLFPASGCRPGYGCAITSRPDGGAGDDNFACLPDATPELTACHDALIARGVPFEPTLRPAEAPAGSSEAVCEIADPVWILDGHADVALLDTAGNPTPRVLTSCESALAIASTIEDVAAEGVVGVRHYGSYSCRTIAGSSRLSQHAYADAFDIFGFDFVDGTTWTLVDDWEHDTTRPSTEAGAFLYDAAHRWHDARYWNIILTPNYNADHDDHFHVDLTPGADSIGFADGRYIGPAPYAD